MIRLLIVGVVAALGAAAAVYLAGNDERVVPRAQPLSADDLRNATLADGSCAGVADSIDLPRPLQLRDGEVPDVPKRGFVEVSTSHKIQFADVDGNGSQDGLVPIICSAGGSGRTYELHAFGPRGTDLGWFEVGEGLARPGRPTLRSYSVNGGEVSLVYSSAEKDEPLCCGSRKVEDSYLWLQGRFVRQAREITTAETAAKDLLDRVNARNRLEGLAAPQLIVNLLTARAQIGRLAGCTRTRLLEPLTASKAGVRTCIVHPASDPSPRFEIAFTSKRLGVWRATGAAAVP